MTDQTVDLIKQLSSLSTKLSSTRDDPSTRNEALQLSRRLTASLEEPANVAVELAFSVSLLSYYFQPSCQVMSKIIKAHRTDSKTKIAVFGYCRKDSHRHGFVQNHR